MTGGLRSVMAAGLAALACQAQADCARPLAVIGFDAEVIAGSKQAVLSAADAGRRLRVGWSLDFDEDGEADLTHWADAGFVSVFEGEVFTQLPIVHRQIPQRGNAAIELSETAETWSGLIGTDGRLRGRYSSGRPFPSELRVRSVWCAEPMAPAWRPVYVNGPDGETLSGDKQMLFAAIRAGQPIRVGWGLSRGADAVEHTAEPVFLSITDDAHVVAQLPEHVAQRGYWHADQAFFEDGAVLWRGVISTTGSFDAVWVDRGSGQTVRRMPQRARVTWFVDQVPDLTPPTLAVKGGVRLDEARRAERVEPEP